MVTIPQAFHAVDRGFFDSLDDKLAERAKLLMSLPEGELEFIITFNLTIRKVNLR